LTRVCASRRLGRSALGRLLLRAHPGAAAPPTLRDVQHALARERGAESWSALVAAIASRRPGEDDLIAFLSAAARGDAAAVAAMLDASPDLIDRRGVLAGHTGLRTALHFGVSHEPVVRTLLERGADPNVRDEGDCAYPLHFAAERGDLAIVRLLVEHGADPVGAGTTHELDVLGWAVCFDYAFHLDVARYLLARGAVHSWFTAAAMGEAAIIGELARTGANPDARMDRTNLRRTALHLAVAKRQPAAVEALVAAGASLNLEDAAGLTPLDNAALDGDAALAARLAGAGATLTLPAAVLLGRLDEAERLLEADPTWHGATGERRWADLIVRAGRRAPGRVLEKLLAAAMRYRGGLSIVNMQADAESAIDGAAGYTPLHAAAFHGNDEAVAVLLRAGANPRARDGKYCGTPAGWARYAGHHATANLILDGDVDLFDAIDADRADVVEKILERDPEALDRPFGRYATCPLRDGQWWPVDDCTPRAWATARGRTQALRALTERGAALRPGEPDARATRIATFLQFACWDEHVHGKSDHRMYDRAAQRLLASDPTIARDSLDTAIVCGDVAEVRRILADHPTRARERGGPRNWTPLLYAAYTRFTHRATLDHAVEIARLLLDHGADPNDFYMAGDARYSVLVGAAGEGEQDAPRQPYAAALFELLLERGAEPFDVQVLYNTHFSGDMLWWLERVYAHTAGTSREAAWRDPAWTMFDMGGYGSGARFLLETAVKKRDITLSGWLLAHGADPNQPPARDPRFPKRTLYELALMEGQPQMAELLARHGARRSVPVLDDREAFADACFRLDRKTARAALRAHPEYVASHGAHVAFQAARRDRADVLALLRELGVPLDAEGEGGKRPLHEAAAANALGAAAYLIDAGVAIDPRDAVYGGAPIGWAAHADRTEMVAFLSQFSRAIFTLCFHGYVDRVRQIVAETPALAHQVGGEGETLLWWLPDDEATATQIVELLLAAGVDPAAKNKNGRTAAEWARRRGMYDIAARLERAALALLGPARRLP
jgi:ankyrin repeat protein